MNYPNLYIHIPFCEKKCDYCAFYSEAFCENLTEKFLEKLEKELQKNSEQLQNLQTIFIGGGTPSILSVVHLKKLFSIIHKNVKLNSTFEFSIESNPESLNTEKAKIFQCFGINRVSLGVQSFNLKFREIIGRKGDVKKIEDAINFLQKEKINNLNFDLIFAIPQQTTTDWENELKIAMNFPISHLSTYALSLDENSILAKKITNFSNEEKSINFLQITKRFLKNYGFNRYEISNYAKKNFECQHNNKIWHGEKYLGLGAAATSFDGKIRWQEIAKLSDWLANSPPEKDEISAENRAREIFIIGLRTCQGWNKKEFQTRTNFSIEKLFGSKIEEFTTKKIIKKSPKRIAFTDYGLRFADFFSLDFL